MVGVLRNFPWVSYFAHRVIGELPGVRTAAYGGMQEKCSLEYPPTL